MQKLISITAQLRDFLTAGNLRLIVLVLAAVAAVMFVLRRLNRKSVPLTNDPLERQALKREGRVRYGETGRVLEFSYRNMRLELLIPDGIEPKKARVNIDIGSFPDLLLTINAAEEDSSRQLREFCSGQAEFDSHFRVMTSNMEFAEKFLGGDIRLQLREFGRNFEGFTIKIAGAFLVLEIILPEIREQELDRLLNTALLLCDRIKYVQKALSSG